MSEVIAGTAVDALHAEFERLAVRGFWQARPESPKPIARLWRWRDIQPLLMRSAEVINLGQDSARRFLGLQIRSGSLSYGFQIVMPGESAEAHRHSASALRFVVEGQGAYTTSDGEAMVMTPGDLLTQPNWVWHDHNNDTADPIIWVDSLDSGIARMLGAAFHEKWPAGRVQPVTRPPGYSAQRYGLARPPGAQDGAVPCHYRWSEVRQSLAVLAEQGADDSHDGVLLQYTNPVTAGHTLRNIACTIQMLRPGQKTRPHRHTGLSIYHVFEGAGATRVGRSGETDLAWQDKDVFTVPSWEWHQHQNRSDRPAYLFAVSDRPIVEAAGLYREETESQPT